MNKATDPAALLESALIDALGAECLLGEDAKTLFSTDVYGGAIAPTLVVRPRTQEHVADAVRIATTAGWAITQRGGGMSYTGGYLPTQANTVMLDLSALNRIISINEEDLVITVEAGVTWQQIWEALTPRGLRLPFFGTFSGSRATVGGGLSNGALFMGTARYGSAADIVVGMEVIDARGRRIQTGQAAFHNGRPRLPSVRPRSHRFVCARRRCARRQNHGIATHDADARGRRLRLVCVCYAAGSHPGTLGDRAQWLL